MERSAESQETLPRGQCVLCLREPATFSVLVDLKYGRHKICSAGPRAERTPGANIEVRLACPKVIRTWQLYLEKDSINNTDISAMSLALLTV